MKTFLFGSLVVCYRLLVIDLREDAGLFLMLATIGHYSLFPLIYMSAGWSQCVSSNLICKIAHKSQYSPIIISDASSSQIFKVGYLIT